MQEPPVIFEFTNEYRTWYCVRFGHSAIDWDIEHEKRRLYMYQNKVGYCGSDSYRFRDATDRLVFLLKFEYA